MTRSAGCYEPGGCSDDARVGVGVGTGSCMTSGSGPQRLRRAVSLALVMLCALALQSCASATRSSPYNDDHSAQRNIAAAQAAWQQAKDIRATDPERAEALLRQALTHDLYHGPSHNDLGVLLLQQGRLYDAAVEFEWARKQMPGHPDPRVNLAIALELGGQVEEALAAAQAALDVQAAYLPAIQTLAWIQLRYQRTDDGTLALLDAIRARSDDPTWRDFAERHRLKMESSY